MEHGTLIELSGNCVDFWSTDGTNTHNEDHVGFLNEGDWIIFLGVTPMPSESSIHDDETCDLLHVISRFGVGYINSAEVPEYSPGGKIKS